MTSPAFADSFYLKNGDVIEGSVLKSTLNTLTLQTGSTVRLTSINQIDRVVLTMADGSELAGELLGWTDGVFELRSADEVMRVADGEVLGDEAEGSDTATAEAPAGNQADEAAAETSADIPIETIAMRSLPSFTLKNGDRFVGKILHATGSVLTIRPQGGSALPLSRAQVETISFENEAGEVISGKLIGWEDGIYRLQLDDRELLANLPDDAAQALSLPAQAAVETGTEEPPKETVLSEAEQADAAILPSANVEEPDPNRSVPAGAGGPANETEVAELTVEEGGEAAPAPTIADGQHLIQTLVDTVDENKGSVLLRFELDKPAARPLVVLYAATEASAKAGEDFEAKSGVITFATGSTFAEVEVPIIDDDQGEESETFNLFLSGDPETIAFGERQIAVTINDDD